MAKRAPANEAPFRPLLDLDVVSAVLTPAPGADDMLLSATQSQTAPNVVRLKGEGRVEATQLGVTRLPFREEEIVERYNHEKRIMMTRSEHLAFDRFVTLLARRVGAQVKASHVLRAFIVLAINAEGEIDQRAGEGNGLVRPPNGDLKALHEFERNLARLIGAGLRDGRPL